MEIDNEKLNDLAPHPLQSSYWGEFRGLQGQRAVQVSAGDQIVSVLFRPVPKLPFTYGYVPKCGELNAEIVAAVKEAACREKAVFVKFEPEVEIARWKNAKGKLGDREEIEGVADMAKLGLKKASRTVFDEYSFILNLEPDDEELLANMHHKTRYNIRVARKKGVKVEEMSSKDGVEVFLKLNAATTKRQRFHLHNDDYFRDMWDVLGEAGVMRVLVGRGCGSDDGGVVSNSGENVEPLCAWILFEWKDCLYYPYGASSDKYRNLMTSNLVAWEAIQLGKRLGCKSLDLWGSLGTDPDFSHPWAGFHRFKLGYGGDLVELVGSWDLVLNPVMYWVLHVGDKVRWWLLRKGR